MKSVETAVRDGRNKILFWDLREDGGDFSPQFSSSCESQNKRACSQASNKILNVSDADLVKRYVQRL